MVSKRIKDQREDQAQPRVARTFLLALAGLTIVMGVSLPATSATSDTPPPTKSTMVSKDEIQGILGKKVLSGKGQDMGQIINVIVDHEGHPRAVVVDFGGFLGVGSRKVAVDWNALHFAPEGKTDNITLDLTLDQVKAAPEYADGKPVVVIVNSGKTQPLPSLGP